MRIRIQGVILNRIFVDLDLKHWKNSLSFNLNSAKVNFLHLGSRLDPHEIEEDLKPWITLHFSFHNS